MFWLDISILNENIRNKLHVFITCIIQSAQNIVCIVSLELKRFLYLKKNNNSRLESNIRSKYGAQYGNCPGLKTKMATTEKKLVRSKSGLRMVTVDDEEASPFLLLEPEWIPDNEV